MEFNGKTIIVAGSGKSGIGSASLLSHTGAKIIIYDGNCKLNKDDIMAKLNCDKSNISVVLGELSDELIKESDIMVLSPGVPIDAPFVNKYRDAGKVIWGEIELAYRCSRGDVVAITGTNGKTTTTALVGEIMAANFDSTFVVGNIGNPYTLAAKDTKEDSVTVAEISSFQLESIDTFHPHVTAVLNITPDHLNRHYTMENYTAVKMSITKNQTPDEICVLNYDDEILREEAKKLNNKVVYFSSSTKLENGYFLDGRDICVNEHGVTTKLLNMSEMNLVGVHNAENVMAAIAISVAMKVPMDVILDTVKKFKAVEHRIEYVETINDVIYYNDSKGTNSDASVKAIEAMSRPTVLIAGGYDKHTPYDAMIQAFDGKIKHLVLLGATRFDIEKCAREHGYNEITMVDSLKEAVELSAKLANPGDAVLLSPGCASWDMFDSYEQRGRLFKEYVREMM